MAKWSRYNVFTQSEQSQMYLFNTRTGALISLNSNRQKEIENSYSMSRDFIQFLLHQGFLVGDDSDELELIKNMHSSAMKNLDTFSATIELTEACNFTCTYCYQKHIPNHMGNDVCEKVIRYLSKRMKNVNHLHVNWFGGEPLIQKDRLLHISHHLKEEANSLGCSYSQHLTTNGYFLSSSVAKELATIGIKNVQITLDGDKKSHDNLRMLSSGKGTYVKVLSACKNVIDAGMELLVRINVNRWNANRIENLLLDLTSLGINPTNTIIHATRMVNHGNCTDAISSAIYSIEEFADAWKSILQIIASYDFNLPTLSPIAYNCPFDLKSTVMIGCDGSIHHCSSSNERIADLTEEGDETNYTDLYQLVKERKPWKDDNCRTCLYLPMCMGGCSYLQEIGEEKCIPEKYILPYILMLSVNRTKNIT